MPTEPSIDNGIATLGARQVVSRDRLVQPPCAGPIHREPGRKYNPIGFELTSTEIELHATAFEASGLDIGTLDVFDRSQFERATKRRIYIGGMDPR